MSGSENISYLPSDGLSYDPAERLYWDKEALDKEMTEPLRFVMAAECASSTAMPSRICLRQSTIETAMSVN